MKSTLFLFVFTGLVLGGIYIIVGPGSNPRPVSSTEIRQSPQPSPQMETPTSDPNPTPPAISEPVLPNNANLDIPFITQAPFRSWKEYPFNHTCEEASVLQVYYYFEKKQPTDESKIRQELLELVDFEIKNYGIHEDTSASQTAKLIKDYYGYDARVYYDIFLEDIKKELAAGNPVIIPAAGRLLGNPNFTPPGPLFHMLVLKGYTSTDFIANDPGTYRTGADWKYSYQTLENAIHDWNDGDVLNGKRAMIVVYPQNQ